MAPSELSLLQASYAEAIDAAKEPLVDIIPVESDECLTHDLKLSGTRTFDVVDLQSEPAEEVFGISLLDCIVSSF